MQGFLWVFCCRFFTASSADVLALCVYHVTASQPAWGWALRMPWPQPQPAPGPLLWLLLLLLFSVLWSRSHWDVRRASDPARLLWTVSGPGAEQAFCPCGRLSPGEGGGGQPSQADREAGGGQAPFTPQPGRGGHAAPRYPDGATARGGSQAQAGAGGGPREGEPAFRGADPCQRPGQGGPCCAVMGEGRGVSFQQEGRKCPAYQGQLRPMAPVGTPEPTGPPVHAGVGPWSPVELWPHRRHALRCLTSS